MGSILTNYVDFVLDHLVESEDCDTTYQDDCGVELGSPNMSP
jgi:hypothetical protein